MCFCNLLSLSAYVNEALKKARLKLYLVARKLSAQVLTDKCLRVKGGSVVTDFEPRICS